MIERRLNKNVYPLILSYYLQSVLCCLVMVVGWDGGGGGWSTKPIVEAVRKKTFLLSEFELVNIQDTTLSIPEEQD